MVTERVFRCASDPIRRAIIRLLARSPLSVSELASHFEVSRPAVSRHLRVLRDAGVVSETRSGRERIYRLERRPLEDAAAWLRDAAAGRATEESGRAESEIPVPDSSGELLEASRGSGKERNWRQW